MLEKFFLYSNQDALPGNETGPLEARVQAINRATFFLLLTPTRQCRHTHRRAMCAFRYTGCYRFAGESHAGERCQSITAGRSDDTR